MNTRWSEEKDETGNWHLDGCAVGGQGIARGDNPDELRLLL